MCNEYLGEMLLVFKLPQIPAVFAVHWSETEDSVPVVLYP